MLCRERIAAVLAAERLRSDVSGDVVLKQPLVVRLERAQVATMPSLVAGCRGSVRIVVHAAGAMFGALFSGVVCLVFALVGSAGSPARVLAVRHSVISDVSHVRALAFGTERAPRAEHVPGLPGTSGSTGVHVVHARIRASRTRSLSTAIVCFMLDAGMRWR